MEQLRDHADPRLMLGCTFCDRLTAGTRDHVPSRIFLDAPLPPNLPVVPSCITCNKGSSADEEYVGCLVACAVAGTTDPEKVEREKIRHILRRRPRLRERLERSRRVVGGTAIFEGESRRLENVILKLARGHAAFELSKSKLPEPDHVLWDVLPGMEPNAREAFDAAHVVGLVGEVGSRATQRMMVIEASLVSAKGTVEQIGLVIKVDVQPGRYRYLAIDDGPGMLIKIVISEFLACEVRWSSDN